MVSGQLLLSELSETKATIGFKVQLSASSVTTVTSGGGAGSQRGRHPPAARSEPG